MQELEKNTINLFGEHGKQWLNTLPEIVQFLADNWQLTNIVPMDNMTWNYVAKATSATHGAAVLKVSCDEKLIHDEVKALEHFSGHGIVELIKHDTKYHAVLLHQAIPGKSLRNTYLDRVEETINNYSGVVKQLISVPQQDYSNFKHIRYWLKAFNRTSKTKLPTSLFEKAIDLKDQLLASNGEEFVLHGDLHHDNILSDGNSWIAIDPKGIVGEVEFEAACFDFIHKSELGNPDVPKLFNERSKSLSKALRLDHKRLKDWVFVRLVLNACWLIEDNCELSSVLESLHKIFPNR